MYFSSSALIFLDLMIVGYGFHRLHARFGVLNDESASDLVFSDLVMSSLESGYGLNGH